MTVVEALREFGYALGTEIEGTTASECLSGIISYMSVDKDGKGTVAHQIYEIAEILGSSDSSNVTETSGDILGKTVADLVDGTVSVTKLGDVTASLKYVEGWTEFSSVEEEQNGYYLPVTLNGVKGTTMSIEKNGIVRSDKKDIPFDASLVFRVQEGDVFIVYVDDKYVQRFIIGDNVEFGE